MNTNDYYLLFDKLAKEYPSDSLWTVGPSEPTEWWKICKWAIQDFRIGNPTGTKNQQMQYWRNAYKTLEGAAEVMFSAELLTMGE